VHLHENAIHAHSYSCASDCGDELAQAAACDRPALDTIAIVNYCLLEHLLAGVLIGVAPVGTCRTTPDMQSHYSLCRTTGTSYRPGSCLPQRLAYMLRKSA